MAAPSSTAVPSPTADQRRIAAVNFEKAKEVLASGNHDYAIDLLRTCCQLDPASLPFRQALRKAQKAKYGDNQRGSRFAFLSSPRTKTKLKAAKSGRNYLNVLEYGEELLTKNPWDVGTLMDMAEAFDALGLIDLAVFSLGDARHKSPDDPTVNRALARLLEKRGDFKQAIRCWQQVQKAVPTDVEAAHKAKDLAASETIARGGYQQVADGSRESPVVGRLEQHAADKGADKLTRDAAPLQKRIEADPTEPTLYVQLAQLYRRHHQDDRARAVLQQGLAPTGQHFSLQLELMELDSAPIRANLEQADARLKTLRSLIAAGEEPTDGPSEEELASLKHRLVKELTAREVDILRIKADRFPTELTHRLELGYKLMKAEQLDAAIAELQQVRKDEKLKGKAALFLGACFRKRNNWRLAQRNYEEALTALPATDEPARKEVLYQLAVGSADHGDTERALDLGHELASMDFAYKGIGDLLDKWEAAKTDG